MNQPVSITNRRKFPRFIPKTELFILHSHFDFGKIVNIGMGGMLFMYAEAEKDRSKNCSPAKGILFTKEDDYLLELPYRTVTDKVVQRTPQGKFNIRKRAVVFRNLSSRQVDQLERLLLDNISNPSAWEDSP